MEAEYEHDSRPQEPQGDVNWPCYCQGCPNRTNVRLAVCSACMGRLFRTFNVPNSIASLVENACHHLAYYQTKVPSLKQFSDEVQVRILVLAVSPDAALNEITDTERKWADSLRRGLPNLSQFQIHPGKDQL